MIHEKGTVSAPFFVTSYINVTTKSEFLPINLLQTAFVCIFAENKVTSNTLYTDETLAVFFVDPVVVFYD